MGELELDERTEEGIVNRLVLGQTVESIAANYRIPIKIVDQVYDRKADEIWRMRQNWAGFVQLAEPLASDFNRIIFHGMIARRAFEIDKLNIANDALKHIGDIMATKAKQDASYVDTNILDRMRAGMWEEAGIDLAREEMRRISDPSDRDNITTHLRLTSKVGSTPLITKTMQTEADKMVRDVEKQREKEGKKVEKEVRKNRGPGKPKKKAPVQPIVGDNRGHAPTMPRDEDGFTPMPE